LTTLATDATAAAPDAASVAAALVLQQLEEDANTDSKDE
jgi:hypothetical protein